jgi:hypothetical protein
MQVVFTKLEAHQRQQGLSPLFSSFDIYKCILFSPNFIVLFIYSFHYLHFCVYYSVCTVNLVYYVFEHDLLFIHLFDCLCLIQNTCGNNLGIYNICFVYMVGIIGHNSGVLSVSYMPFLFLCGIYLCEVFNTP